jgi:hypothetical protein
LFLTSQVVIVNESSSLSMTTCDVKNNTASVGGCGIFCYKSVLELVDSTVNDNKSDTASNGAIYCYDNSSVTIEDCEIKGNSANSGAGISCQTLTDLSVQNCVIENNEAKFDGGGVFIQDSPVTIAETTFLDNVSQDRGGGVACDQSSILSLVNCVLKSNFASNGGGIYNTNGSPITIFNCLLYMNTAEESESGEGGNGGAIMGTTDSNTTIINCTIVKNDAKLGPALSIFDRNTIMTARNCIIWGNGDAPLSGWVTMTYSDVEGSFTGEGNIDKDPLFAIGSFGDYYLGNIKAGQASNSPCINAGKDQAVDVNLDAKTTSTDDTPDSGIVDMGYHYIADMPVSVGLGLRCFPNKTTFSMGGDHMRLLLDIQTPSVPVTVDVYFVLLNIGTNEMFFAPMWNKNPAAVAVNLELPINYSLGGATLFSLDIPSNAPPVKTAGSYIFALGTTRAGKLDFISNIATLSFDVK